MAAGLSVGRRTGIVGGFCFYRCSKSHRGKQTLDCHAKLGERSMRAEGEEGPSTPPLDLESASQSRPEADCEG